MLGSPPVEEAMSTAIGGGGRGKTLAQAGDHGSLGRHNRGHDLC